MNRENETTGARNLFCSCLVIAAVMVVLSVVMHTTAEASTAKSISSLNIDPIDNQIVEVVTQAQRGTTIVSTSASYIYNILNQGETYPGKTESQGNWIVPDKTVPFGSETDIEGVYSFPSVDPSDTKTRRVYILYSFGSSPTVTVRDGVKELVQGKDYSLTYSNNKQIGKASVTISGMGDYSGELVKYYDIIGYRLISYYPLSNNGQSFNWGGERTWPNTDVDTRGTSGSVTIIMKNKDGDFVVVDSKDGQLNPLFGDKDTYPMLMDVNASELHPQVDSSKDASGNYLWPEYESLTSKAAQQFDTPVDTGRLYMKEDSLSRYNLPSWECHNAHFAWTRYTPNVAEAGWTLSDVVNPNQLDSYATYSAASALYGGSDTLEGIARTNINTSSVRLRASTSMEKSAVYGIEGALNIDESVLRDNLALDFAPVDSMAISGNSVDFAGFEVTLKDNGVADMMKQAQDAGYLAKKMVSDGTLIDLPINDESIVLKFKAANQVGYESTVFAGTYIFIPYDLTSGDTYDGGFYKDADDSVKTLVISAANNAEKTDDDITKVTHGATVTVEESNSLVYDGQALSPSISVKTALQENILDDEGVKEGTDYEIVFAKYDESSNEPVSISKDEIRDVGKYRVTIKGLYPDADVNKIGTADQAVQRFCGSVSQDFEVLESNTYELSKAIEDAKAAKEAASEETVKAEDLGDKEDGFQYRSAEKAAALDTAIADAEKVMADPNDQAAIDNALKKLQDAMNDFAVITHKVNVDDLKTAQEAAQAKLDSTSPSSDGGKTTTDGVTLAKDANWSDATAYDALKSKADEAKGILDKEEGERGVTQNQVAALVEALEDQTEALVIEKATGPGTSTEKINLMSADISLKMAGFVYDGEHAITMKTVLQDVKLNGKTLTQDVDFSASFKGKDDNKTYASITLPGDYYVVITGIGDYTGSASKSFTVTKASTEQPSGLTVATSAHENGMVYLTGYLDGNQVALTNWTTTPQNVAIVTDTNKDGVLEVAFQAPGTVTISVQTADAKTAKVVMSSSIAPEGETVDTTKLTDDASGVEVDGLSKKSVEQDGMRLVVKSGNDAGILSSVDTTKEGNRSIGMYDVRLYIGDTEVQPAGSITISFPVDVTSVPDGMKMVAYHWHGNTTTPKEVVHEKIENGKALFTVRELSPFEVALVQNDGTDEHDIASASVVGLKGTYYATTGQPLDLGVSLVSNGKTLVNGTDYEVQLQKLNDEGTGYAPVSNAEKSGVYKLLFTGKGDYTGVLLSNPFNIVVDGDMTGIDNGLIDDPDRNNQNLGSNLDNGSGGSGTGLSDTGTKGSSLAQTGDRQLVNLLALMAMILGAGGVSLFSKRKTKKIRLPF